MCSYPYTHEEHAAACVQAARDAKPLRQYVQVDYHGAPVCGVIRDAWDKGLRPMWKVEMIGEVKGFMSFPVRQVRKCSGVDEQCHCEKRFGLLSTNG
jgi:hypothetical protein